MFLLVPAYLGSPGQKAVKQLCVCVCVSSMYFTSCQLFCHYQSHCSHQHFDYVFIMLLLVMNMYPSVYILGAAQCPPRLSRPPVSANAVASHLVKVAKSPSEPKFERFVRDSWWQFCCNKSNSERPEAISSSEILNALKHTKTGTAPGYDNIHPEFLGHLGPRALAWLAQLFTRMLCEHRIPKNLETSKGHSTGKAWQRSSSCC